MKRLAFAAALLGALAAPAAAQTVPAMPANTVTFVAVDALRVEDNKLYVTGVVTGEAAASERGFTFYTTTGQTSYSLRESCERLALVAMAKPGQYTFEIAGYSATNGSNAKCKLTRVSP
jgi:hypothetical protein